MAKNSIMVQGMSVADIEYIYVKTDVYDIVVRDSIDGCFSIYFDLDFVSKVDFPASLVYKEKERSISYEIYEKDYKEQLKSSSSDNPPAIIINMPIKQDFNMYLETELSDIYLSEAPFNELKKKVFCKSVKGNVLRKTFMYFDKIEV